MGRSPKPDAGFDRELADLPAALRWREWMGRVEALIFSATEPVPREKLALVVGDECQLDLLIADIRDELRARPYELVAVAGGFQHRTRRAYADMLRACGLAAPGLALSHREALVVTAIAYFQPVTRAGLADIFGTEISRDTIAALRRTELIAAGPRSPQPGAPYSYVTTAYFLALYEFDSLRDLPDMDRLEQAGLLGKVPLADELRSALGMTDSAEEDDILEDNADEEDIL